METIVPKLTAFFLDLLYFGIDWLYNAMIDLVNAVILVLSTFLTGLVALFPANPCGSLIASCSDAQANLTAPDSAMWATAINTIAWLIPMEFLVNLVGCAMMGVMSYFLLAPLLRWGKIIT